MGSIDNPRPELYVRTRCLEIAKYILFELELVDAWLVSRILSLIPDCTCTKSSDSESEAVMPSPQATRSYHFSDEWYGSVKVRSYATDYK